MLPSLIPRSRSFIGLSLIPRVTATTTMRLLQSPSHAASQEFESASNIGGHMMPHRPEDMEVAKERALKGKGNAQGIPGMDGWEQSLASDSEAIVKAERMPKDLTPEDLQKISVDLVQAGEDLAPGKGATEIDPDAGKTAGIDVSNKPGFPENIAHSRNDPEARGHDAQ